MWSSWIFMTVWLRFIVPTERFYFKILCTERVEIMHRRLKFFTFFWNVINRIFLLLLKIALKDYNKCHISLNLILIFYFVLPYIKIDIATCLSCIYYKHIYIPISINLVWNFFFFNSRPWDQEFNGQWTGPPRCPSLNFS